MQLKQKIDCIGNVVECGKKNTQENAIKPVTVTELIKGKSVTAVQSKNIRKSLKRTAVYQQYESYSNSNIEDEPLNSNYQPQQKKQVSCKTT